MLILLFSSCAFNPKKFYSVPKHSRHYILERQTVGYQCPKGMYLDLPRFQCMTDNNSGAIKVDSNNMNIGGVIPMNNVFRR